MATLPKIELSKGAMEMLEEAKASVHVKCPWQDPEWTLPIDTPCPVCGCTGASMECFDKCVG